MSGLKPRRYRGTASAALLCAALLGSGAALACTTLAITDAQGGVYFGRTLEMAMESPYQVSYFPAGRRLTSTLADGKPGLDYQVRYAILAVTVPLASPTDLKILEGLNAAGLTFSALAFPAVGPEGDPQGTHKALAAIDLGSWALGQFATVAQVKQALEEQPVVLTPLSVLGNAVTPFHYVLHDRGGAAIVIEYVGGRQRVYDNPVKVMTNAPGFPWHLTNLGNYSFLNNLDQSEGTFGGFKAVPADSGVATAGLPAANTSVARFVRAAYYAQYAQRAADPDGAVQVLAHVMNNFDRPLDITIDAAASPLANEGAAGAMLATLKDAPKFTSEYTLWTALSDLNRGRFFLRTYQGLNYHQFDFERLKKVKEVRSIPLATLNGTAGDSSGELVK